MVTCMMEMVKERKWRTEVDKNERRRKRRGRRERKKRQ